ncbi:MAG: hypothetical protein M3N41_08410 [Acidobacteriota bacterium]|nr:hypothetical protein [Acidobacteriota bacterium]
MKLGENFGEWEFERWVFGAQNVAFEFLQARYEHAARAEIELPEVTYSG